MVNHYKDLKVWQLALELGIETVKLARKVNESGYYSIGNHIIKTSISVPSNIAEGFGRRNDKEFTRFIRYAIGSLHELETQLIIYFKTGIVPEQDIQDMLERITLLGKMLNSLIKYLQQNRS
jgi:four helix bundle protein